MASNGETLRDLGGAALSTLKDIPTILGEFFAKFQTGFYADPVDAVVQGAGCAVM